MEFFAKIEGVDGESAHRGHEDWIEVASVGWGVSQSAGHAGGGVGAARAGRATLQPLLFTARTSSATPPLFLLCVTGRHVPHATFEAVASGGDAQRVAMRIELEDATLSSITVDGTEQDGLSDAFSIEYQRVRLTTFRQDPRGGEGAPVTAGWDVRLGRPL